MMDWIPGISLGISTPMSSRACIISELSAVTATSSAQAGATHIIGPTFVASLVVFAL